MSPELRPATTSRAKLTRQKPWRWSERASDFLDGGAVMSKITWIVICFAVPFVVGLGFSLFGVSTTVIAPVVGLIVMIIWVYGVNNRPVTKVSSANRDQMLAQGPPANYGLVYVHRGPLVGGLAVGIDVKLDNVNVAQLKVARFTRLVVAPGSHLLAAGSKTPFGQLKQIAEAQRAEASFAISAGETAVFELKMIWTGIKKGTKLELVREADATAALDNLARAKMVASEQPAGWTPTPAPMQAPLDS
jgi:hypothetical protein